MKKAFVFTLAILVISSLLLGRRYWMPMGIETPNSCTETWIVDSLKEQNRGGDTVFPSDLSLLSWNVYKEQRTGFAEVFDRLKAEVDFLALQESLIDSKENNALAEQGYNYRQIPAFSWNSKQYGVLFAAEGTFASCGMQVKEPLIQLPKTAMIVTINTEHGPLVVVNIHGVNFSLGLGAFRAQLDALCRVLEHYSGPLIFAGDFNTWSDSRRNVLYQYIDRLHLVPFVPVPDYRNRIFGERVDHIFFRGVTDIEGYTENVGVSDHNPIIMKFSIPKENAAPILEDRLGGRAEKNIKATKDNFIMPEGW